MSVRRDFGVCVEYVYRYMYIIIDIVISFVEGLVCERWEGLKVLE